MKPKHSPIVLAFILLIQATPFLLFAQSKNEASVKKVILASTPKDDDAKIVQSNVDYPTVLKGNEAETKDYIEKFATSRKDYVIKMHKKGATSFPKIISTFKKYNLHEEYKVLIALESAFNGNAVSPAGAVGYWQIMDMVAKEYGLNYIPRKGSKADTLSKKKVLVDDRKNFDKSTKVAARYLKDRNRNLKNNVLLVVASYNCGVGNVWKAMAKTGKTNPTFWDVKQYLPTETRNYVMNFIALNVLFHNYNNLISNSLVFRPTKIKKGASLIGKNNAKA